MARRRRLVGFARRATVSFAAGLAMGAVCWALGLTAPAPTLLGLTGLLGVGLGERAAALLGARPARGPGEGRPPGHPKPRADGAT
ncbi:XapX domain-containing protein [Streptomyces sp. NPDC000229]|uniref:XapX domain-containing protein n=1 Tax=Streptomyces sp. NPDC000229 TaxID=3154247 RepID=UPI00332C6A7A